MSDLELRVDLSPNPSTTISTFFLALLGSVLGVLFAAILIPNWQPNLVSSLEGINPKGYWYLSRGSAFIALGILWLSMVLGITMTNRMARIWPGSPAAFEFHEFLSLLGLTFTLAHGLLLLGDHYIRYSLVQILMPFASQNFHPVWVGIGQVSFYLWGLIILSFYIRKGIGQKSWRIVHYLGYTAFMMAWLHGITVGTDSGTNWVRNFYWFIGSSLLFLLIYRIITSLAKNRTIKESIAS